MQQGKAVFCRMKLKSPSGQQQCRQDNFQPGLLLVSTWACILTLGWSVSSQVQGQQTTCRYQNWPHSPEYRIGIECINQERPGYGVHGLPHKGTHPCPLPAQPLSAFHADLELWTSVSSFFPQSPPRGKNSLTGASTFCFTGSSVAILIYFDKTYFHSHNTEAAAEEIPLFLRIWSG